MPKLGPDGKQIVFTKLVLENGQMHRNHEEPLADYGARMELMMNEIDEFYPDFEREGVAGSEGFNNYGFDLKGRSDAEPEKENLKSGNRIAWANWFIALDPVKNAPIVATKSLSKGYTKWVDLQIKEALEKGEIIPNLVID
jgi:hypothetical protein